LLGETVNPVETEHVNQLCGELKPLLEAELAAGNSVVDTWAAWPHSGSLYIRLGSPFKALPKILPPGVRFRAIDDPYYWKSELVCDRTHHAIACRFDEKATQLWRCTRRRDGTLFAYWTPALPLIKTDPAMLIRTNPSGEIDVWSYSLSK
jgi:hypothetical protein